VWVFNESKNPSSVWPCLLRSSFCYKPKVSYLFLICSYLIIIELPQTLCHPIVLDLSFTSLFYPFLRQHFLYFFPLPTWTRIIAPTFWFWLSNCWKFCLEKMFLNNSVGVNPFFHASRYCLAILLSIALCCLLVFWFLNITSLISNNRLPKAFFLT